MSLTPTSHTDGVSSAASDVYKGQRMSFPEAVLFRPVVMLQNGTELLAEDGPHKSGNRGRDTKEPVV